MVFPSSLFETLAARPPTPPRDPNRDIGVAIDFLSESIDTPQKPKPRNKPVQLDTPPEQSPSLNVAQLVDGTNRPGKRVNFSPWTNWHKAPDFSSTSSPNKADLRPLPPRRTAKPLKSILKSQDLYLPYPKIELEADFSGNLKAHECANFAEMLEVIAKQLASEAAVSRRDAYVSLSGTLQAYEGEPNVIELKKKLPLLMQYIERDVVVINPATNSLDMNLVAQSLKLALILMRYRGVSEAMTDDFRVFLLERCITVLKEEGAPKAVVNNHLHFLSQQQFGKAVMTSARVEKILESLKDIDERIKGNSVVGYRLMIYQKLMKQSPAVMINRMPDWIEHLFHGMLSSVKDIKIRAIDICRMTGIELGGQVQVSRTVIEILDRENSSGNTFADYVAARLLDMVQKKRDVEGVFAPQIWAAVVLLLRGRRHKLDGWKQLRAWLEIFQRMVNSSSPQIRNQANLAWAQFIYVIRPEMSTPLPLKKLLRSAIQPQLDQRKGQDKLPKQCRQYAFSCYHILLYYALNPSAPAETLQHFWMEYVFQVLTPLVSRSQSDANAACRLLTALFWSRSKHIWNERKALESTVLQAEDIPPLDPKWIRQKMPMVLEIVKICLNKAQWNDEDPKECGVRRMWKFLMEAVAEAGSKEVTASMDLKEAIAHFMNMLQRIKDGCPASLSNGDEDEGVWTERFAFLVETSMEKMGAMHFADRVLARNGQADFEAAPTPTHRSRTSSTLQSPLLHLVDLISGLSPQQITNLSRLDLMKKVLVPCWQSRSTRKAKLELLKDCAEATLNQSEERHVKSWIWQAFVDLAVKTFQSGSDPLQEINSRASHEEYKSVLKIINVGLHYSEPESVKAGQGLLTVLCDAVRRDCGETAIALAVIEPLSKMINDEHQILDQQVLMSYVEVLFSNFSFPIDRPELERNRKAALNNHSVSSRVAGGDPVKPFYQMFFNLSTVAYDSIDERSSSTVDRVLAGLCSAISSCPSSSKAELLKNLQDGIAVWVKDENRMYDDHSGNFSALFETILVLWNTVVSVMGSATNKEHFSPASFEVLFEAGLLSSRRTIANATIDLWNKSISQTDGVECPQSLLNVLARYRGVADINLPPGAELSQEEISPPDFIDSQTGPSLKEVRPSHRLSILSPARRPARSPLRHLRGPGEDTPRSEASLPQQRTPRSKLRHEDSQIEFQAIDSSPPNDNDQDSQMLTDRQREVRERQRDEGALFPDIRSSPNLPVRPKGATETGRLTAPDGKIGDLQQNLTPVKENADPDSMDFVLGSSPTPAPHRKRNTRLNEKLGTFSRRKNVIYNQDHNDIDEIPSSPPQNVNSEVPRSEDAQNILVSSHDTVDLSDLQDDSVFTGSTNYGSSDIASSFVDLQSTMQLANEIQEHEARRTADALGLDAESLRYFSASGKQNAMRTTLQSIQSDIFVDAVADQTPPHAYVGDDFFVDASSFPAELQLSASAERLGKSYNDSEIPRSAAPQFNRHCIDIDLDSKNFDSDTETEPSLSKEVMRAENEEASQAGTSSAIIAKEDATVTDIRGEEPQAEHRKEEESPISSADSTPAKAIKRKAVNTAAHKAFKRPKNKNAVDGSRTHRLANELPTSAMDLDDDDDVFDCIVVKPKNTPVKNSRPINDQGIDARIESDDEQELSGKMLPPPGVGSTRRRGRPGKRNSEIDTEIAQENNILVKNTPQLKRLRSQNYQSIRSKSPDTRADPIPTNTQVRRLTYVDVSKRKAFEPETPVPYGPKPTTERSSVDENVMIVEDTIIGGEASTSSFAPGSTTKAGAEADKESSTQGSDADSINPTSGRSILTPRSIINRLKKILADCQQLVLGSHEEEREIDYVLFEVRREVHDAARRGSAVK